MATITAAELAIELNTTAREVRKFLRADAADREANTPGKGSRYAIEKRDIASLRKRFIKWTEAKAPKVDADTEGTPEVEVPDTNA